MTDHTTTLYYVRIYERDNPWKVGEPGFALEWKEAWAEWKRLIEHPGFKGSNHIITIEEETVTRKTCRTKWCWE